jgi:CBS domain-containing protein
LCKHDVSALPVIDERHNLVGILSEADLLHRVEIGTERHRPSWLEAVTGAPDRATAHLWGLVGSDEERKALIALAETVPGVARVSEEISGPTERRRWRRGGRRWRLTESGFS